MSLTNALQNGTRTYLSTLPNNVDVNCGDGDNIIKVTADDSDINVGNGDNQILFVGDNEQINAGNGDNSIVFWGDNYDITAGHGDNLVETLDFAVTDGHYEEYADYIDAETPNSYTTIINGVTDINVNLGDGNNTVALTVATDKDLDGDNINITVGGKKADFEEGVSNNNILVRSGYTISEAPPRVYVFGNRWYPVSTTKSRNRQADYSVSLVDEYTRDVNHFGSEANAYLPVFDILSDEAKEVSDNYGGMFNQTVIIAEDGSLVGVYDTDDLIALNPGITSYDWSAKQNSYAGQTLTLPDGMTSEVITNFYASPLAFDLDGDGIETSDSVVKYDIDGDGQVDNINDSVDAILCINGGDDGSELFGNNTDLDGDGTADGYSDGFAALKALAEKEGLINGSDDMELDSEDIKVLQDKYSFGMKTNGYNSAVVSLESIGITSINLAGTDNVTTVDDFDSRGNILMTQEGATFDINGQTREYADIWHKKLG